MCSRRPPVTTLLVSLAVLLSGGCRTPGPTAASSAADDVRTLCAWMTGPFSSAAQAAADPEHYRDIRLHMVPIWPGRADGPWLYVEQAAATALDRPYRQRVYRLRARPDGAIESAVYTLPGDPRVWAGAWREPERFAALRPEELQPRTGCALVLRRQPDGSFRGSTVGTGCESTLQGARYATSEATIWPDRMVTWDRGFDAEGRQVWGAEKGGYEFRKEEGSEARRHEGTKQGLRD